MPARRHSLCKYVRHPFSPVSELICFESGPGITTLLPNLLHIPGSPGPSLYLCYFMLSHFSRVRLCDSIDSSPPGSLVPGILQARTLEWVAISFSNAGK